MMVNNYIYHKALYIPNYSIAYALDGAQRMAYRRGYINGIRALVPRIDPSKTAQFFAYRAGDKKGRDHLQFLRLLHNNPKYIPEIPQLTRYNLQDII